MDNEGLADAKAASPFRLPRLHPGMCRRRSLDTLVVRTVSGVTAGAGDGEGQDALRARSLSATQGTAGEWVSDGQAQDRRLLGTHGHDSEQGATGHQQQGARTARPAPAHRIRTAARCASTRFGRSAWPRRSPSTSSSSAPIPLERDAAELYAPPDGYLDAAGAFHRERQGPDDVAVYEVTLRPEDGLYPLPYMARQADGQAWEDDGTSP